MNDAKKPNKRDARNSGVAAGLGMIGGIALGDMISGVVGFFAAVLGAGLVAYLVQIVLKRRNP